MKKKSVGRSLGKDQTPSLVPPAEGPGFPPPPDLACQRQPLNRAPPARYPAAPLPPLLGRESGSGRRRILPPGPASSASHPLSRDPRGVGRRLELPAGSVPVGCAGAAASQAATLPRRL